MHCCLQQASRSQANGICVRLIIAGWGCTTVSLLASCISGSCRRKRLCSNKPQFRHCACITKPKIFRVTRNKKGDHGLRLAFGQRSKLSIVFVMIHCLFDFFVWSVLFRCEVQICVRQSFNLERCVAMQPGVQDGCFTLSITKEGINSAAYYMKMSLYKWILVGDGQIALLRVRVMHKVWLETVINGAFSVFR